MAELSFEAVMNMVWSLEFCRSDIRALCSFTLSSCASLLGREKQQIMQKTPLKSYLEDVVLRNSAIFMASDDVLVKRTPDG